MRLKKTQYAEMVKIYRSGIVEKYKLYHTKMASFGFCVKYWVIHNIFGVYASNYVFNMYKSVFYRNFVSHIIQENPNFFMGNAN